MDRGKEEETYRERHGEIEIGRWRDGESQKYTLRT